MSYPNPPPPVSPIRGSYFLGADLAKYNAEIRQQQIDRAIYNAAKQLYRSWCILQPVFAAKFEDAPEREMWLAMARTLLMEVV